MWWMNSLFLALAMVFLVIATELYIKTKINKELLENGLMPKYDSKKLAKWCWVILVLSACNALGATINVIILLL